MSVNASYAYAVIEKETCRCFQTISTETADWSIENELHYSVPIVPEHYEDFVGKYYYDNTWWRREWVYEEAVDEEGNTYQKQTEEYVDYPWPSEAN